MPELETPMKEISPDDTVQGPRVFSHRTAKILGLFAAIASLYHLITAGFGTPEAMIHRAIHIFFIFPLIFAFYAFSKKAPRDRLQWIDVVSIIASLVVCLYVIWDYNRLAWRFPYVDPMTILDETLAAIAILLVLEATRRTVGWALVTVALVFLGYALWGSYLPGYLAIKGVSLRLLLEELYMIPEGVFGSMTGLSATFVYLFILYGSFLKFSKAGDFFIDFALAFVGRARGGPAKVAIFASCLFGTMSGSAVANVFGTGTFTIPLMKKVGYKPHFAGAVEAAASTGGQIMPPVMGSAAFIMSDFTGIPYLEICLAALIPALLYYFCIYVVLDLEAIKTGLRGLPKEEIPALGKTLKWGLHLIFPVVVIVVLLALRFTPQYAAFWAIVSTLVVCMIRPQTRMKFGVFVEALKDGAMNSVAVAACLVCAGIIVGVTGLTGLGLKFTATIVYFSGGNLALALILIAVVTTILGMGLPTPAAYFLVAIFGAPALVELGIPKLFAHMFCFYYAILSAITPPVAMAAYAGAAIAKADFMQPGFAAVKRASEGFIVPFLIVFDPGLSLKGSFLTNFISIGTAVLGILALGSAVQGWFLGKASLLLRGLLLISSLLLFSPFWIASTNTVGAVLLGGSYFLKRKNRLKATAA
ncbi:MAG: TRAP transporter permease [Deltaproteobacteria bacterium]|nr:TRAP transporter permease [Deltaproteobacteria bacterium]